MRGRDAESEGHAIKVGPDQVAADRGPQEVEEKQELPPEKMKSRAKTRRTISHLRSWIIKSAGEPFLDDHSHPYGPGRFAPGHGPG
jgi:hypothetical protein